MPESTESKQTEPPPEPRFHSSPPVAFVPRTMGIFILLIIILAFIAGAVRRELALSLTGAAFLVLWLYCLLMTLLLALIHRRRSRRISIRVSPRETAAGRSAEILYSEGEAAGRMAGRKIFTLPGIMIRCRLLLSTADGRRIRQDFDPVTSSSMTFTVHKRGAYFSSHDELAVFDILGFFRCAWRIPAENGARLLASPPASDETPLVNAHAGDSNLKPELSFQRSDNLIDHRPYIPGDDPRRINWKLYGHGGELFVREGEREPPPHSNIIIMIDTQFDPLLYSVEEGRGGIDLLCENALAAARAAVESGIDVLIGYTGGVICGIGRGANAAELAAAFAWPAALPFSSLLCLPAAPADRAAVIFALPRSSAEPSALDRFLHAQANRSAKRAADQSTDLIFLYDADGERADAVAAAAETCASLYRQRPGMRVQIIAT